MNKTLINSALVDLKKLCDVVDKPVAKNTK